MVVPSWKLTHASAESRGRVLLRCAASSNRPMIKQFKAAAALGILVGFVALCPSPARAQSCSVDFTAKVTPAAGVSEPVRGLPFYLLNKSFTEILADADAAEPKPDFDAFVDKLRVSTELKAWMRKNHFVSLSGEEFVRGLSADDIMNVPEFFSAYLERNGSDSTVDFPKPKYKERDKQKDPARFEKQRQEYLEAIRKYLQTNTESTAGMELTLDRIIPAPDGALPVPRPAPPFKGPPLKRPNPPYLVGKPKPN